jgi:DNA-binding response OmpR family regulator
MLKPAAALLIDDDARLGALLSEYLGQQGITVVVAGNGELGLKILRQRSFDVVLLDLMLPGMDGFDICRQIRGTTEFASLPIIMLTARGEDIDKVVGLELGADDYLAKPFNPRELLARMRAVLRRSKGVIETSANFKTGALEIDFHARELRVRGNIVAITAHEFEVLSILARACGRVLSRDQILDSLRGGQVEAFDRSIDVHVSKLRAKIEPDPKNPVYIKTVRGAGYLLVRHSAAE